MRTLVAAALVLVTAGCGTAPRTSQTAPTGVVTTSPAPAGSGAPDDAVGNPPPRTIEDLLLFNVHSGEWSLADGLLAVLRTLAGEADAPSLPGGAAPSAGSVTGVITLAREYLADPTDTAAAAEIERLLDGLSYSPERLRDMASSSATAVAGHFTASGALAAAEADCAAFYAPDDVPDGAGACLLASTTTVNGKEYVLYVPALYDNGGWPQEFIDAASDSLSASPKRLDQLGPTPPVIVVLSPTTSSGLGEAFGDAISGTPCVITIHPAALAQTIESFRQVIAHEIGHCWQGINLADANMPGYDVVRWREEGLANYLSNLVYPSTNLEWNLLNALGEVEQSTTILTRSYGNSVFFQYLANVLGDEKLIDMLKPFPTSGTKKDQEAALASVQEMQDLYHEFVRAYTTHTIEDTSGQMIPTIALSPFRVVAGPADPFLKKAVPPFGVRRYEIRVPGPTSAGGQLKVTFSTQAHGPEGREGYLKGGTWFDNVISPLPAACAPPLSFIMLMTSIYSGRTFELDVPSTEDVACGPVPDPCLMLSETEVGAVFGPDYGVQPPELAINVLPELGVKGCSWHGDEPPLEAYEVNFNHLSLYLYPGSQFYDEDCVLGEFMDVSIPGTADAYECLQENELYRFASYGMLVGGIVATLDVTVHISVLPGRPDRDPSHADVRARAKDLADLIAQRLAEYSP